jgi:uncharacterized protein
MTVHITPSKLAIYRKTARERDAKLCELSNGRMRHAWEIAHQAARILKEEFGASRVVLFGSLLHPELFHMRSDIDLAVWDIQSYFRAVSHLMDIDPEIGFDLVPVEDARPCIMEVIEQEGVEL